MTDQERIAALEDRLERLAELTASLAESAVVHAGIGVPGAPVGGATYEQRRRMMREVLNTANSLRDLGESAR